MKKLFKAYFEIYNDLYDAGIIVVPGFYSFDYYINPEKYDRDQTLSKNNRRL